MPIENIVGRAEIIFFSVGEGEARMGNLALAVVGALGPVVHDRSMSRKAKTVAAVARDELESGSATRFADKHRSLTVR